MDTPSKCAKKCQKVPFFPTRPAIRGGRGPQAPGLIAPYLLWVVR